MEYLKETTDQHKDRPPKLLSLKELLDRVHLSKSRLYSKMNEGTFPRPINVGDSRVAWLEPEVDAYIAQKIEERNAKYSVKGGV